VARKITLTVPDGLYEQIDQWRNAFNLSRIFQEAMTDAIRRKEEFQQRVNKEDSMAEIIRRLRREKISYEKKTFREAEEEGRKWAARAAYEDLITAVNAPDEIVERHPALAEQITQTMERLSRMPANVSASFESFRGTVVSGWKHGVYAFWSLVQHRI